MILGGLIIITIPRDSLQGGGRDSKESKGNSKEAELQLDETDANFRRKFGYFIMHANAFDPLSYT